MGRFINVRVCEAQLRAVMALLSARGSVNVGTCEAYARIAIGAAWQTSALVRIEIRRL